VARAGKRRRKKVISTSPIGPKEFRFPIPHWSQVVGICSQACEHGSHGGPIRDKNDKASWA